MSEFDLNKEEIGAYTDFIVIFIGIAMMILGLLSKFEQVPKEFSLGATMAGFFFVLAEFSSLSNIVFKNITKISIAFYIISLLFGVFSFILVPAVLLMYPNSPFTEFALENSDAFTFMAFGLVIGILGIKNHLLNNDNRKKLLARLDEVEKRNMDIEERLDKEEQKSKGLNEDLLETLMKK